MPESGPSIQEMAPTSQTGPVSPELVAERGRVLGRVIDAVGPLASSILTGTPADSPEWVRLPLSEMPDALTLDPEGRDSFFGASQLEDNPGVNSENLRIGLGRLAAELFGMSGATWRELAERGGYDAYLSAVEAICTAKPLAPEYGRTIADGEGVVEAYAAQRGLKLVYVSGFTGARGVDGATEVLLSETNGKPWTHQPHGGGRNKGEGALAAMLRETGEELGWDAAVALLEAFRSGEAYYAGYYASRIGDVLGDDAKGADTLLAIQCFIVDGKAFEGVSFASSSDSKGAVWLPVNELPEGFVTTTQGDYWLRKYFGAKFPESAYTYPGKYDGIPK